MTRAARPLKLQRCYEAVFSHSGESLFTLSRDVVGWDIRSRSKRFRAHPFGHPSNCAVHPDDTSVVVKNTAGQIALLDAHDGSTVRLLDRTKDNEGSNVLYSVSGEHLVDGSWSGQLTVRSATSGEILLRKDFPREMITCVARTTSGDKWFVVHQPKAVEDNKPPPPAYISVWSWPFSSPLDHVMYRENTIKAIAVSPDDTRLCVLGYDSLAVLRLKDKKVVSSAPHTYGGTQYVAAWAPDGQEIATVEKHSVSFYAPETMKRAHTIELQYACDVAYSPDGMLVALGSWSSGMLLNRTDAQQGAPADRPRLASLGSSVG